MATEITDIDGVGPSTAEKIKSVGAKTLDDVAQLSVEALEDAGLSERKANAVYSTAKESAVIIQTGDDVVAEYKDKSYVPTGIPELDRELGGGWEEGFLTAIAGESGFGKTQLSFQALVSAVESTGKPAVYVETERGRYRTNRLQEMASKSDTQSKIHRVKAYDLETQENAYDAIRNRMGNVSLVVIDSFTARFRLSDDFAGRGTLSQRSTVMGRHLTKLEKLSDELKIPVLITAQVYGNPSQYGSAGVYGGSLFHHTVSFFLMMKNGQGDAVKAQIRNHPGCEDIDFELHIDTDGLRVA